MDRFDIDDLPPTPFEIQEAQHARARADNERRERIVRARRNRARGFVEPRPGTTLYVSLDPRLSRRTRAGLRFARGPRVKVSVEDLTPEEVAIHQKAGAMVVNPDGAEILYEDSLDWNGALAIYEQPGGDEAADQLRAERDAQAAENAKLRAELAELREARQRAPESKAGEPTRLQAARAVAQSKASTTAKDEDFEKPAK